MAGVHSLASKEYAKTYAKYRPTYPPEVKTAILNYAQKEAFSCDVALDVACGSGQASFMFADIFNKIHAIDKNQAHFDHIYSNAQNVTFSFGNADSLEFADNSIDLVTIAQGLRWLDIGKFYAEVKRVLKPGGVLAAFGHDYTNLNLDKIEANVALYEFDRDVLQANNCWLPGARLEDNNYKDFEFPLRQFERITKYEEISEWNVGDVVGLIETLSASQIYKSKDPSSDAFEQFKHKLMAIYQAEKPVITLPIFILLGRK